MTERLVVEKGPRQRSIEGALYFVLPPAIGAICWWVLGPGLWQGPAILIALIFLSVAGNWIAVRLGGELMTPAERWQRSLARISARPLWLILLRSFLTSLLLFIGLLWPMFRIDVDSEKTVIVIALTIFGAVVVSGFYALHVRSQIAVVAATAGPPAVIQSPWPWLAAAAPLRLIALAVLAAGYMIARRFHGDIAEISLLLAGLLGLLVESVVKNRRRKATPLLWHNFSFLAALTIGAVLNGTYFALFFGTSQLLEADDDSERYFVATIFALTGFVVGMLISVIPWALARVNSVKTGN